MPWLYALLLALSFAGPFAMSFEKKLRFFTDWKYFFPASISVAAVYIAFDIYFTKIGVWGFNPLYHFSPKFFGIPVEEIFFFILIPYSSLFIHLSLAVYRPNLKIPKKITTYITLSLIAFFVSLTVLNYDKLYTLFNFSVLIFSLVLALVEKSGEIRRYYISFLLILIPFILVNGILTGTYIEQEVVWYNNAENLGIRFLTIPIEDFGYGFSLIFFNILGTNYLKNRRLRAS